MSFIFKLSRLLFTIRKGVACNETKLINQYDLKRCWQHALWSMNRKLKNLVANLYIAVFVAKA